jgi:predicted dehydrogenase
MSSTYPASAGRPVDPAADRKIRIGLIGCGSNMTVHAGRLLEDPRVEIAGLAEPSEASLAAFRERRPPLAGVPAFASHHDMLREIRPDAVEISTPHTLHFEQIVASLEAGCHVLVEKPMVSSAAHAREVIRLAEALKKVVLVSYQRRYQPAFRLMRQIIASGSIGEVQFVNALQNQQWYRGQKAAQRWRIRKALSGGGQLNDSGSHLVDALLFVTDLAPETVYCQQDFFDLEVDVNSAMTIRFAGGAMGNLAIVGNAPGMGGAVWEDITIYGSEGAIYYRVMANLDRAPGIEVRLQSKQEPEAVAEMPAGTTPDANFVGAILGLEEVEAPPICGLRVAELSEAAWRSAETGRVVRVEEL